MTGLETRVVNEYEGAGAHAPCRCPSACARFVQSDGATNSCSIACAHDRNPVGGADAASDHAHPVATDQPAHSAPLAGAKPKANGASHASSDRRAHSRPYCDAVSEAFNSRPHDCGAEHGAALSGPIASPYSCPKHSATDSGTSKCMHAHNHMKRARFACGS